MQSVAGGGMGAFAWSPDGHWLVLARYVDYPCNDPTSNDTCTHVSLWIVNATDGRQRRIMRIGDDSVVSGVDWRR